MKYIKTYENKLYKVGDYIVFNMDIIDQDENEIVIRKDIPYKIINVFRDVIYIICDDKKRVSLNMDYDKIRKIPKSEAKILLDAEKYNL